MPGIANTAERYLSDALNFFQNRGLLPSDPNEIASRISGADEIMVHDHWERLRSYELLAQAFGLERVPLEQATGE